MYVTSVKYKYYSYEYVNHLLSVLLFENYKLLYAVYCNNCIVQQLTKSK